MTYKGYEAHIEYSAEDERLIGRVMGIADIVTFHGASVAEIEQAFQQSVDHYLAFCAERGEDPNKPYSGKFLVRLPAEQHAAIAAAAARAGQSLNAWVVERLRLTPEG